MRIAIVQQDHAVPLDGLGAYLEGETYEAWDRLPGVDDFDGLVLLGGKMSVDDTEEYPYLLDVENLLRAAVSANKPVLAICLGAQQLAKALGGRVQVGHENGAEQGVARVMLRPEARKDPVLGCLYSKLGEVAPAPVMHSDGITRLPNNATWLAYNERYPYHAFRVGSALGVQFHPEATRGLMKHWLVDAGAEERKVEKSDRRYLNEKAELDDAARAIATGFLTQVTESLL
jgi:GMP synthase (glutamine-hydrolysing)